MRKLKIGVLLLGVFCLATMGLTSCKQKKSAQAEPTIDSVVFEEMEVIEYDEDEIWADENVWAEEDIWADAESSTAASK